MKSDLVLALYEHYIISPTIENVWVMQGPATYCGCRVKKEFISIDGDLWHLHESNERPKEFVIPLDLFMRDEFNIER